jgi:hypothetical protein
MDGKLPLLLASVLFAVGATGLLLTSAERADWGPFESHETPRGAIVYDAGRPFVEPPSLQELRTPPEQPFVASEQQALVAAPESTTAPATPEPTATPVPPLRVFGISSDTGVSAAAATVTPPPIVIGGVAADDGEATETASDPTDESDTGANE